MTAPHEDRHVFGVWSPNMATALAAINMIGCAHLLRQIVPCTRVGDEGSYWLIFKDDSWVKEQWNEKFPGATILPRS